MAWIRLPHALLSEPSQPIYNYDDNYVRWRVADFQNIYQRVRNNLSASQDFLQRQHAEARQVIFSISDTVFVQVQQRQNKPAHKFQGLYRVIVIFTEIKSNSSTQKLYKRYNPL